MLILKIITVISLLIFVISTFVYYLLKSDPDESKVGKWIKNNKKYLKYFNNIGIISLLLTLILLLILINV